MLIDRTHRVWLLFSVGALAVGALGYVLYSALSVRAPSGGSAVGLIYGGIGSAFMLFAGLLGGRKKLPVWRIGRTTTWMRGHLWLGTLSFPFILFHGAFRLGSGTLTRTLMVLFIVVFVSGLFGAVLQHFIPRLMTERVAMETIYEQIDRVRGQLVQEADGIVRDLRSALAGELAQANQAQRASVASAGSRGGLTYGVDFGVSETAGNALGDFWRKELQPFLGHRGTIGNLADPRQATGIFKQLRVLLPSSLWPKLDDLQNLCDEKRDLDRQRLLHRILHGWLLVHVPASYALLLLAAIHAVVALRY